MFRPTSCVLTFMCLLAGLVSSGLAQTFTSQKYDTGPFPVGVASADFNGDGVPDLAVTDFQNNQLSILLNNGDGTFTAGDVYSTGTQPMQVLPADFNGDGIQDLAVVTPSGITIFYGNGDGTFGAGGLFPVDGTPIALAVPDLNGDGFPDWAVVVAHANAPSTLELYPNDGSGNFSLIQAETLPSQSVFRALLVAADFNQDGIPDLAVGAANQVLMFTGNGDGTVLLQNTISPPQTASIVGMASGSFTGSGVPDLVVRVFDQSSDPLANTNSEYVYLNAGDGTMNLASHLPASSFGGFVLVADLNGDGLADIVSIGGSFRNGGWNYALSHGDGTFDPTVTVSGDTIGSPGAFVAADLNGDSRIDLVIAGQNGLGTGSQGTYVFLNNGN